VSFQAAGEQPNIEGTMCRFVQHPLARDVRAEHFRGGGLWRAVTAEQSEPNGTTRGTLRFDKAAKTV
jgi:hypothetical protein